MCFVIHLDHQEPKIAKRDITCYKSGFRGITSNAFYSYYKNHRYVLGEVQEQVHIVPENWEIEKGYHSYSNKKKLQGWCKALYPASGYVKCIIPKGTRYWYDPSRCEYVSETIIVQEYIEP